MDEKWAEFVGILLGDGSIAVRPSKKYSTFYCVKVTLDSREVAYRKYVAALFYELLGVKPKIQKRPGQNAVDIVIYQKGVVEILLKIGLKRAPKWKRAVVPLTCMNKELGKYVLRGYFDTDGSVVIANNNGTRYPRLEMKISPSPMQKQLLQLLNLYEFHYGVYDIGRGKVRVQMNGKKAVEKWYNLIGFSNEKHRLKAESFLDTG
ncbi:MAG: hypothetical protein OXR66_04775 [Candidatus Woesearchaeota archaeon]|nr:hypothetical protein [Candidatus Woesearchaeota archaeon]